MARILATKEHGVTVGVFDKDLQLAEELLEVTFEDELGIPHTVFAHRDGPWKTAEEIIAAWGAHELHTDPVPEATQPEPPKPADSGGY